MAKFTGKTVLIADGTTDIGLAIAKLFLKEGARIAISGQDARRVEDAARTVGPEVIAICANIASQSDMANVAAQLQTSYGKIDFVFASVGIVKDDCSLNFKGVICAVQNFLPILNNPGSIIFTSATLAQDTVNLSVYAATKTTVRHPVKIDDTGLLASGVRRTNFSRTDTMLNYQASLPAEVVKTMESQILSKISISRHGQIDQVAKAVLFLAHDHSSSVACSVNSADRQSPLRDSIRALRINRNLSSEEGQELLLALG